MPKIMIQFTISKDGKVVHTGKFNYTNDAERKNCASRFNQCLLDGYKVETERVSK